MSVELITYGSDRRLELGAAEAVRAPVYLDDWTTIRIGLQISMNAVASNIVSTPVLAFGVCNGNTNVLAAATADHVVGIRPNQATWTYNAGPPSYFAVGSSAAWQQFKKIGTVVSTVNTPNIAKYISNTTTVRTGWFLEITKGSPNYTFRVAHPVSAAASQSDVTDTEFVTIMELSTLVDIGTVKTNYNSVVSTSLAVSEADGVLDHIFVYWDRTTHKPSFNIRHRKVA